MTARTAALLLALATILDPAAAASAGGRSPGEHPSWTVESCRACHGAAEVFAISGRVSRPCRTLCASCHAFRDGHHSTGATIRGVLPAPMVLTAAGASTCVTCHDTTVPRVDKIPWESQSLFARIARRSSENPTRYLAMRNDRGQLCRACH